MRLALVTRLAPAPLVAALIAGACGGPGGIGSSEPTAAPPPSFEDAGRPFLERHCTSCHGAHDAAAGLDLSAYVTATGESAITTDFRTFDEVAAYVADGTMPPETESTPSARERERFLAWLGSALERADRDAPPDPGRVTMRRLNRAEYRNTVRDLLGVDYPAVADFPADDVGYGYDNVGDVLTLPPLLLERYLAAAEDIAEQALAYEDPDHPRELLFTGADLRTTARGGVVGSARVCSTNGEVWTTVRTPRAGEYLLRASSWAQQAGPEIARLHLRADGRVVGMHDIRATRGAAESVEARVALPKGAVRIAAAFVNDFYAPKHPDPRRRDRNLAIESLVLVGPVDARPDAVAPSRALLLAPGEGIDDPAARRTAIVRALVDRAFRRPASDGEIERLTALWTAEENAEGGSFERGLLVCVQATLVSPHFLFRVEPHPHPDDPTWVRDLHDFALASRLSYFLWSSMPDERLLGLAREGRLREELAPEAARMLDDPRAIELVRNFGSQWLETRRLATTEPDSDRFPEWSPELAVSMERETELFLWTLLREERSAHEIVDADWTFADERLARHYGIDGVRGDAFVRVSLPDRRRGGVLGHASVLTISSYPTRTSPVKRGKWLLDRILGAPTPPPPPGVGDLPESGEAADGLSLRERMARHRTDPTCAVCHVRMDPLGFALENFDAIGRWRERDGDALIDPAGELPDGRTFSGPAELRAALLADDAFVRNLTSQLLTYALGRGPLPSDQDVVTEIVKETRDTEHRLRDLVIGVATSIPFRRHRGEAIAADENGETLE